MFLMCEVISEPINTIFSLMGLGWHMTFFVSPVSFLTIASLAFLPQFRLVRNPNLSPIRTCLYELPSFSMGESGMNVTPS